MILSASTQTNYVVNVYPYDSSGTMIGPGAGVQVTVNPFHCIIGTAGDLGSCIADSMPIAGVGIMLSLSFVAVAYMMGEVLRIDGFQNWYRGELWEVTKSALIIAVLYSVLVMVSNVSTAFASNIASSTGGTFANPCITSSALTTNLCALYQNVYSGYLTPQLNAAYAAFSAIMGLSVGLGTLTGMMLSTWFPIPLPPPETPLVTVVTFKFGSYNVKLLASNFLTSTGGAGYSFLKDILTIVIVPMLMLLQFQYDLLPTIVVLGLSVFVPMGVILRSMPFLRPIGGTMIGIGIAIALVYPTLMLVLNMPVTNYFSYVTSVPPSSGSCATAYSSGIFCDAVDGVISFLVSALSAIPTVLMGMVVGSQNVNVPAFNNGLTTGLNILNINSIFPVMNFITRYGAGMSIQFILFFLDMIITLIAANAIAKPLGGSVRLGVGKFKLA